MKKKVQAVFKAFTFVSVMFFVAGVSSVILSWLPLRVEMLYMNCTAVALGLGAAFLNKTVCFGSKQ